ncbi:MAG: LysR family transcriptional regulator [Shimia sp.]|uniref:LysR family transcriptional regulator n=1 Tax=Shimia sp. TaxID=1954381 RepID=UPI0040597B55
MKRNLPPLNALRAFEAAARHESFSRAAKELGVGHSAISRQVRGLEHRLGIALFHDLPRGVALTDIGRAYLEEACEALDILARATEALAGPVAGRVVVSCEPRFARSVLVPRIAGFHALYPEVEVRLVASRDLADVNRYEADIALRFASTGDLEEPSDLVSDRGMHVYAAPDLRSEGWSDFRELLQYRRFRDRNIDVWWLWAEAAGMDGAEWGQSGWRMQAELAYEYTLCGQGVYLGASDCVMRDFEAGRLVRCFPNGLQNGAIRLVMGAHASRRKVARSFRRWLLEETRDLRGEI